jgi:hypothetical protein
MGRRAEVLSIGCMGFGRFGDCMGSVPKSQTGKASGDCTPARKRPAYVPAALCGRAALFPLRCYGPLSRLLATA